MSMTVSDEALGALIERVEKATGPDLEIDAELMALVYVRDERHIGVTEGWEDEPDSFAPVKTDVWVDPTTDKWVSTAPHDFTASVDAALALVERVLPGRQVNIYWFGSSLWAQASLGARTLSFGCVDGATAPLAILLALLHSLTRPK